MTEPEPNLVIEPDEVAEKKSAPQAKKAKGFLNLGFGKNS